MCVCVRARVCVYVCVCLCVCVCVCGGGGGGGALVWAEDLQYRSYKIRAYICMRADILPSTPPLVVESLTDYRSVSGFCWYKQHEQHRSARTTIATYRRQGQQQHHSRCRNRYYHHQQQQPRKLKILDLPPFPIKLFISSLPFAFTAASEHIQNGRKSPRKHLFFF